MQNALYGGKQKRANNIAPKGKRPAKAFLIDEVRKKQNEKRRVNELREEIRTTEGKKRMEMIKLFKQLKEKRQ